MVTEAEGEDNQNSAGRTTVKNMDTLHKPAVPGKGSEEDLEAFLSSNPLADWKSQVHGQPDGRYLTVVSDIFPTTHYFKWDTFTLLPSVEYKTRLAVIKCSAIDCLESKVIRPSPY